MFEASNFNHRQLEAMEVAGTAVDLLATCTYGHDPDTGPREFLVYAQDDDPGLAVIFEGGGDAFEPVPFCRAWGDDELPANCDSDISELPVVHVGTVSTADPLGCERDDYHLYRIADPKAESEVTRGLVVTANLERHHELVPVEDAGFAPEPDDSDAVDMMSIGDYVEIIHTTSPTGYYVTDAAGAQSVIRALTSAIERGLELPNLRAAESDDEQP